MDTQLLAAALGRAWGLNVDSMQYVPEGGGSHHWKVVDAHGSAAFVTVDDLDDKDWMGSCRGRVFDGLAVALGTAHALRSDGGLEFVVAPVPAGRGELVHRIDDRFAASVFPFLEGTSLPFGPYDDAAMRDEVLEMVIALHMSSESVRDRARTDALGYGGRRELAGFLANPHTRWEGGPFAQPAHELFSSRVTELGQLATGFSHLVERTTSARRVTVITHGEPHPANLMRTRSGLALIDWDTVALAPPERDLAVIGQDAEVADAYQRETGSAVDPMVVLLYRLRWYLDDLASAVRTFSRPHGPTADVQRWWEGVAPRLDELPSWLGHLA